MGLRVFLFELLCPHIVSEQGLGFEVWASVKVTGKHRNSQLAHDPTNNEPRTTKPDSSPQGSFGTLAALTEPPESDS